MIDWVYIRGMWRLGNYWSCPSAFLTFHVQFNCIRCHLVNDERFYHVQENNLNVLVHMGSENRHVQKSIRIAIHNGERIQRMPRASRKYFPYYKSASDSLYLSVAEVCLFGVTYRLIQCPPADGTKNVIHKRRQPFPSQWMCDTPT